MADWNVQLVDLPTPIGMLNFPHPLFADDMDLSRVWRRARHCEENFRGPEKETEEDKERNECPGDFETKRTAFRRSAIGARATAVTDAEKNREQKNQDCSRAAKREQRKANTIDL